MTTRVGRVKGGVIVLDGGPSLPEGMQVTVSIPSPPERLASPLPDHVKLPIVPSKRPGTLNLTAEMVAEYLADVPS